MGGPAKRRATYQDVLDAPDHLVAEIIGGELVLSPRPALAHAAAATALGEELGPPFKRGKGGPGGWILLFEPELHLGAEIVVPDLAAWRRDRLPALPDAAFLTLAPDWVCEVVSPSTQRLDRKDKLAIYGSAGVRHVWLVDPAARTLEILRLGSDQKYSIREVASDAQQVRAEPFDAIVLDLAILWADVERTPPTSQR